MNIQDTKKRIKSEEKIESFLPYSSHIKKDVVICRRGELIATWLIEGVPFETASAAEDEKRAQTINQLLRTIAKGNVGLQVHRVRRRYSDQLTPYHGEETFAADFSRRYNAWMGSFTMMKTEIYLTLVVRDAAPPVKGFMRRGTEDSAKAVAERMEARLKEFENTAAQLERLFDSYNIVRLSSYFDEKRGRWMSAMLRFYNYLATGIWKPVAVTNVPLYKVLGNARAFASNDMIELQTFEGSRFVQAVELKDFPPDLYPGVLDTLLYAEGLNRINYEFIESQSFNILTPQESKKVMKLQAKQLGAAEDESPTQMAALMSAIDKVVNGEFVMGDYSYSILVFGENEEKARSNTRDVAAKLADEGFVPFVAGATVVADWMNAWPGMMVRNLRSRSARITSSNFADLAPFHNILSGKREGNPWGEAIAIMKTPSDQPYYLNLHATARFKDCYDIKAPGNTVVLGSTGVGKTALISFIGTMMMKYKTPEHKFTLVFFDKDHGAEILVKAMAGNYLAIQNGEKTGFNPFALEDTPANRHFVRELITMILRKDGRGLSAMDDQRINDGIQSVFALKNKSLRCFSTFLQAMTDGATVEEKENSVRRRLARWAGSGDLAWVFDNPGDWGERSDIIDFDSTSVIGIDGTDFLDNPDVCGPISYYLLYRVKSALDGRRLIFMMDEFWKWMSDDSFADFAKDMLKTIRKKNALVLMATQSPSEIITNPIARAVVEQTPTKIYLPNKDADETEYVKSFNCTPAEFQVIKSMPADCRGMVVKQNGVSTLAKLDLSAFPDELMVFSSSTDNIALLDALLITMEEGLGRKPRPEEWLPQFYKGVREMRKKSATLRENPNK